VKKKTLVILVAAVLGVVLFYYAGTKQPAVTSLETNGTSQSRAIDSSDEGNGSPTIPVAPPRNQATAKGQVQSPSDNAQIATSSSSFQARLAQDGGAIDEFFVDGLGLSIMRAEVLSSDDLYREFVDRLRTDSSREAREKTAKYQQLLAEGSGTDAGSVSVSDVACGVVLCTASITGDDEAAIAKYLDSKLASPQKDPYDPSKPEDFASYTDVRVKMKTLTGAGVRVLFSTDKSINAASFAPSP
jgi:hypothetical protein